MSNQEELVRLQNKLVVGVTNSIYMNWDYLLVSFEREEVDHDPVEDCLAVIFTRKESVWIRQSVDLSSSCYDLFLQLCDSMAGGDSGKWGSCTLEVDSNGRYRFLFSYDPPRRLNGDFSDTALLKNYSPCPW